MTVAGYIQEHCISKTSTGLSRGTYILDLEIVLGDHEGGGMLA